MILILISWFWNQNRAYLCLLWIMKVDHFDKLQEFCGVIQSWRWTQSGKHQLKMTKFTTEAFVVSTQSNIIAAKELISSTFYQVFFRSIHERIFLVKQLNSGEEETSSMTSLTLKPDVQKSSSFHWFTTFVEPINVL